MASLYGIGKDSTGLEFAVRRRFDPPDIGIHSLFPSFELARRLGDKGKVLRVRF